MGGGAIVCPFNKKSEEIAAKCWAAKTLEGSKLLNCLMFSGYSTLELHYCEVGLKVGAGGEKVTVVAGHLVLGDCSTIQQFRKHSIKLTKPMIRAECGPDLQRPRQRVNNTI